MNRSPRMRSLLSAALFMTLTAAADTFGQSSGATANVPNSTSPKNTPSSVSTSGGAASRNLGNYPIIVPSKFSGGSETNKAAKKEGVDNNSANSDSADNATPPPTPPPSPQSGVSQLSGRTFSRGRNAPQQF